MSRIVYDVDERPPLRETIPLGLQHLVAMLLGNITPPIVIALALGLVSFTGVVSRHVTAVTGAFLIAPGIASNSVGYRHLDRLLSTHAHAALGNSQHRQNRTKRRHPRDPSVRKRQSRCRR